MSRRPPTEMWGGLHRTNGLPMTRDTMALRVSKPQTTPARPGAGIAELPARAQALVAHGDLTGYRALFAQAAEEPDAHRRYTARKLLLEAGLGAPRGSMQQVSQVFLAVAVEGLAILT
jgi:hypothetical protein